MVQHRLAALWFADIVGYSSLSHEDESAALEAVQLFQSLAGRAAVRYDGRVVKFTGDGAFAEFPSTEAAVRAASHLVEAFAAQTEASPIGRRDLRVGVHLGEVAVSPDGDLYGDGVNVTDRITDEAEPGQVVTSEAVCHQLRQRRGFAFEPIGQRELEGIDRLALYRATVADEQAEPWMAGEHRPEPGPGTAPAKLPWGPIVSAIVAALAVTVIIVWKPWSPTDLEASASSVAVLPFSVRASEDLAYLEQGMVSLLATKFRGFPDLDSVDPHAILAMAERSGFHGGDPEGGRAIAERFGAGTYVLGNVVQAGNQLHLDASIYRLGSDDPVARASVEGHPDDLMQLVDQLAASLVASQLESPVGEQLSLAALTTDSLEALKAYLVGEREFRGGRLQGAVESFQRAVTIDPAFALAHYRLGIVASWIPDYGILERAVEDALRHKERLSPPDRVLVEALHANETNQREKARDLLRPYVEANPDDIEGWYLYGEVLFHGNERLGRSIVEARAPFEKVVELDPDLLTVVARHLMEIHATEGNFRVVDSLLARVEPGSRAELEWTAIRAFAIGSPEDRRRVVEELRERSDSEVIGVAVRLSGYAPGARGAEPVARHLLDLGRSRYTQRIGRILLVTIALQAGRWESARAQVDSLRLIDPARSARAYELEGYYAAVPAFEVPEAELRELRRELVDWDPNAVGEWIEGTARPIGFHALYRPYLIGRLDLLLGGPTAVSAAVEGLRSWPEATPEIEDLSRLLVRTLEAHAAAVAGRPEAAEALLSEPAPQLPPGETSNSPVLRQPCELFLRAELARRLDRDEEAIGRYRVLTEGISFLHGPLAPVAHLRLAELHDERGDAARAIHHYGRFVEYWSDGDPRLRDRVVEAERRLEELVGGAGSR